MLIVLRKLAIGRRAEARGASLCREHVDDFMYSRARNNMTR
jgi:hypothetical protein